MVILAANGKDRILIDRSDYKKVSKYSWWIYKSSRHTTKYAWTRSRNNRSLKIHRLILKAKKHEIVDHINGNGLDNRRSNLRICTQSENCRNKIHDRVNHGKKTSSKFKGVTWDKQHNKWRVRIWVPNHIHVGRFDSEKVAAKAYNKYAKKYFGEFARLNKV